MNSFVVVGDIHLREDNPSSRRDNTLESLLKKLEWVIDYTNKNAGMLIFLGDLGERPIWTTRLVNRTCQVLSKCTKPMYTLVGNHDIKNYTKDEELFEDTGLYRVLQNTDMKVLRHVEWDEYSLYGYSTPDPDLESFVSGLIVPEPYIYQNYFQVSIHDTENHAPKYQGYNVAFAHYPVGNFESQWMKDHRKLYLPGWDMAFFGDIHDGFDPCDLACGCTVANPGALLRKSKSEIHRKINIFHVTGSNIKKIAVPHLKGTDVFVENVDNLGDVPIPEYMDDELVDPGDMTQTIKNIGKELKMSKEVIEHVTKLYQQSQYS